MEGAMINLTFTTNEIDALETERYTHPHPKVQRRMEALYLKSMGLPHHQICSLCRISEPTLVIYLRMYQQEGLSGLKKLNYRGRPNGLAPHAPSLEGHFQKHPPRSCAHARQMIQEQTGVCRGMTQVRVFMRGMNMKYRKTGFVPGKADTPEKQAEQAEFQKKVSNRSWRKPKRASGWCFS
jgi:transposase